MPTPEKSSAKKKSGQSKHAELPGVFNQPGEWEGFVALIVGDAYPVQFYLDMLKIESAKPEKIELLDIDFIFNPKQMIDSGDEGDKKKAKSRAATRNKGTKNDAKVTGGEISQSLIASAIKSRLLELKAKDIASRPINASLEEESQEKSKKNKKGTSRDTKRGKSAGKKSKVSEEKKEYKGENEKDPLKNVVMDERPSKYFLISGATNLQLLDCLLMEGIVVNVVFKVSCSCTALNYAIANLTTQDPEVECKKLELNEKLQHFWRHARCFLTRKPTGSALQDVLILNHLIDDCQFKRVVSNECFAKELYDVFHSWFEQLVFVKRHYGFYLDALCLRHLSYAVSYKPAPLYPAVLSQQEEILHQIDHPDEPSLEQQLPSLLVQQGGYFLKIQAPPTHLYHSMLNSLPASLVSVPLILYCMREQVVQWDKIESNQAVDEIEKCVCSKNCSHNNNNNNAISNENYLDIENNNNTDLNNNNNNNYENKSNNNPNKINSEKQVVNEKSLKHNLESYQEEEEEEENDKMNDDAYCCNQIILEQFAKSIFSLALTNSEKKQLRTVLRMNEPPPPLPAHLRCPLPAYFGYHDLINKRLMTSQARKDIEKCKVVDFDPLAAEIEMLHFTKGASILRKIEEMIGGLGAKKKDEGLGGDVGDGWCICGNTTVGSNVCSACYCCDGIIVNDLSQYSYKSMNDNDEVEKEIVFNELFEKCQNIFGCSITKPELHHLLTLLTYESMELRELDDCQVNHPINSKITINPDVPIPWDDPYHFYLPKVGEDSMTKKQENVECDVACESVEVQDMNIIVLNNSEEETSSEKDPKAICTNINLSNCNTTQAKNENSNSFNKEEETTDKKNSPELNTYVDPVPYAVEQEPMPTNTSMEEAGRTAQSVMKRIWKLQKRDLNDFDYEEALDPLSLVQCLNAALLRDCHVTIQKRLSDGCFLVALENLFNKKERYIENDWSYWLTSNCGLRNFYELIYPRIGLWLDGREVEYQALRVALLKEAMGSQVDEHKDDMQKCGFPNVEDNFYVKQNSLKAQLLAWQKSQIEETKVDEEVQEKETRNKKKSGKQSKKKKLKEKEEDEDGKNSELKEKSAKKDLVLFQKPPTLPKVLEFFGYDLGDSMVDLSGISSNMHPLDGGVIKTDHIHFFPERLYVKSSLLKDGNYFTVQVINPRMCCCCYPAGCAICNEKSTKEKEEKKEKNITNDDACKNDQQVTDQSCAEGDSEETEQKRHQSEEEERIICCEHCSEVMPEFASFVGNFHDKLFISFSVFGQDGRPQLIENLVTPKESIREQQEETTTAKTPTEENDKNKKRSDKEKKESKAEKRTKSKAEESEKDKSEMEEEKPKTAEKPPQTCPPFTQTFLQLNASTSDAIEISFMLENTLGVRATNDYDRCLIVKLNKAVFQSDSVESKYNKMKKKVENLSCNSNCLFDFESSHDLKCDGHERWQLTSEKCRYVTVDGDVVVAFKDTSFKVLFSDGAIKMYQKMPIECLRKKMENLSKKTSKEQEKEPENKEEKRDKKHRKDQKNVPNNTSEQTEVNEEDTWCCITTMADGRRYYQDKFVKNGPLPSLKFYTVTDPCTLENITVRDDRTLRVERPDGSVTVEFEDFTRISTIKMLPLNSCCCAFSKKVTTKFCVEHPILPSVHYNGSNMSVDLPHIECCIVAHPKGGYVIKDTSKPGLYSELVVSPHGVSAYVTLPRKVSKEEGVFYKPVSIAETDSEPKISGEGVFKAICSCCRCEMCCDVCGSCEECHLPQLNFIINPVPTNTFMVMRNVFTMLQQNVIDGNKSNISGNVETSKEVEETNETKNNNNENSDQNNASTNNNDNGIFNANEETIINSDNKNKDPSDTNANNCCIYDENLVVTVKKCIETFEENLLKSYYSSETPIGITYNRSDIEANEIVEEQIICSDQEFSGTPQINFTASNLKANKTNQIYFLRHSSSVLVETIDITNKRYRVLKNGATSVNFEVFNPLGTECFPKDKVTNFMNNDTLRFFKINGGRSFGCGRTGTEFLRKDQVEKFIENLEKNQVTEEKLNEDNEDLLAITTMKKVVSESGKRSFSNEKNSYRSVVSPYKDDIIPLGLVNRPFKNTCSQKSFKDEDPCCNGGGDGKKKCDSDLLFEMRKFFKFRTLSKEVRKNIEKVLKEHTDLKIDDKDLKNEWKKGDLKEGEADSTQEKEEEPIDNCNVNCCSESITVNSNESNNLNEKSCETIEEDSVNINVNNTSTSTLDPNNIITENKNRKKRNLSNEKLKVVLSTNEINFGCVKEGHTYRYKLILNNENAFESKRFLVKHPTPNSEIKAFYLNNLLPMGGKASIEVEVHGVMGQKKEKIILNHLMKIFILKMKDDGEKFSFDNGLTKIEGILECSVKAVVIPERSEKEGKEPVVNQQSVGVKRVQTRALKEKNLLRI